MIRTLRFLNEIMLPVKLLVPQPLIRKIPGLTTNEEIRLQQVLSHTVGRLLDVGCGNNALVEAYRAQGGSGVGVDVYPWPGVDTVVENSSDLPHCNESFNTVAFVACINHIPYRELALREAHRVLVPGGKVVVTNLTPLASYVWHKYAFWDRDQHERGMKPGEVWGLTRQAIESLLTVSGFADIECHRFSLGLVQLYVAHKLEASR